MSLSIHWHARSLPADSLEIAGVLQLLHQRLPEHRLLAQGAEAGAVRGTLEDVATDEGVGQKWVCLFKNSFHIFPAVPLAMQQYKTAPLSHQDASSGSRRRSKHQ